MRNLKYYLLFMLMMFFKNSFSQGNLLKGQSFLNVKYGFSKHSLPTYGEISYGNLFHHKMSIRSGFSFEYGKVGSTKFSIPSVFIDYSYSVFNLKNKIFFNLGIGPVAGIEFLKNDRIFSEKINQIYISGRLFSEIDILINQKLSVKVDFAHYYNHFSKIGKWYYTSTIGLGFSF